MRPNLTNVNKVLDRIEEISRKCSPRQDIPAPQAAKIAEKRFVELLDEKTRNLGGATSGKNTDPVSDLDTKISQCAEEFNIDEELIRAVIQVESGWKPDAVSIKGARGLMQLMPKTAAMLGVEDSFDPHQNITGGVKYLAQLTDKYEGDVEKALAAYNAGPSRVDKLGKAPFPETERYVRNVMALYHRYREET